MSKNVQICLKQLLGSCQLSLILFILTLGLSACNSSSQNSATSQNTTATNNTNSMTKSGLQESDGSYTREYAYIANNAANKIETYKLNHDGTLSLATSADIKKPLWMVADSFGKYLYAVNGGDNKIVSFQINESSGYLTKTSTIQVPELGEGTLIIDKNNQHLYSVGLLATTVYNIESGGKLQENSSLAYEPMFDFMGLDASLSPDGNYIYIIDFVKAYVNSYKISSSGNLSFSKKSTSAFAPYKILANPVESYVYLMDMYNQMQILRAESTGALVPTSSLTVNSSGYSYAMAIDPTNRFAYIENLAQNASSYNIAMFNVGAAGTLTSSQYVTPYQKGAAFEMKVDPSGRFVYSISESTIDGYKINEKDGGLTSIQSLNVKGASFAGILVIRPTLPSEQVIMTIPSAGQRTDVSESTEITLSFPPDTETNKLESNNFAIYMVALPNDQDPAQRNSYNSLLNGWVPVPFTHSAKSPSFMRQPVILQTANKLAHGIYKVVFTGRSDDIVNNGINDSLAAEDYYFQVSTTTPSIEEGPKLVNNVIESGSKTFSEVFPSDTDMNSIVPGSTVELYKIESPTKTYNNTLGGAPVLIPLIATIVEVVTVASGINVKFQIQNSDDSLLEPGSTLYLVNRQIKTINGNIEKGLREFLKYVGSSITIPPQAILVFPMNKKSANVNTEIVLNVVGENPLAADTVNTNTVKVTQVPQYGENTPTPVEIELNPLSTTVASRITIKPKANLNANSTVIVSFNGVRTIDGAYVVLSDGMFDTGSGIAGKLLQPSDPNNARNNVVISMGYNEQIDAKTVNTNNFYVTRDSTTSTMRHKRSSLQKEGDEIIPGSIKVQSDTVTAFTGSAINFVANNNYSDGGNYTLHAESSIMTIAGVHVQAQEAHITIAANTPPLIIYLATKYDSVSKQYLGYLGNLRGEAGNYGNSQKNGIVSADELCNSDPAKPTNCQGSCKFKAMIGWDAYQDGRYACKYAGQCGLGNNYDWVLMGLQEYRNATGGSIGKTTNTALLPELLTNPIDSISSVYGTVVSEAWTGLNPDFTSNKMGGTCKAWSTSSLKDKQGEYMGAFGDAPATASSMALANGFDYCNQRHSLYCVEQPTDLPIFH